MLAPFVLKNHIVYFGPGLLTEKMVRKLHEYRIFPVGKAPQNRPTLKAGLYHTSQGLVRKTRDDDLFFYPKVSEAFFGGSDPSATHQREVAKAEKQSTIFELYQSKFY